MANKGTVSCTQTISALFGPGRPAFVTFQNTGASDVFVHWDTAEADKGLRIAPGESVNTAALDPAWRTKADKGYTAICATGTTTTLIWSV